MIAAWPEADGALERWLAALEARGRHAVRPVRLDPGAIVVLARATDLEAARAAGLAGTRDARLLVLSRVGSHPDARAAGLRELWRLEEDARATGAPTLTLRVAPVVGGASPLWRRLATGPPPGAAARKLVNPVAEEDVLDTLDRALSGHVEWQGWYEVAGPDALTLGELSALARGAPGAGEAGAWEPPLEEMLEHKLCEHEPWARHFGLEPRRVGAIVTGAA